MNKLPLVRIMEEMNRKSRAPIESEQFHDEHYSWMIYGIKDVPLANFTSRLGVGGSLIRSIFKTPTWDDYLELFDENFGSPIKEWYESVLSKEEELKPYIEFLNRMNYFLFGGIAITKGMLTLEQVSQILVHQQGGILRPTINLFDDQAFFGRITANNHVVEMIRMAPYSDRSLATIEYMVCASDRQS